MLYLMLVPLSSEQALAARPKDRAGRQVVLVVVVVVVVVVGNARLFKRTHELLLNGGWVVMVFMFND